MKVVTDENSERVARYAFEYGDYYVFILNNFVDILIVNCKCLLK